MRKTKQPAPVFDFGTRPHGLSVDKSQIEQESLSPVSLHSLADGFDVAATGSHAQQSEHGAQTAKMPEVFGLPEKLGCCQRVEAASKTLRKFHYLELTDCEFLHLVSAIEHDRNQTRKAIKKGLACLDDMKGTDSLWQKLQEVRALRMRNPEVVA
jgi:hypothetical protein